MPEELLDHIQKAKVQFEEEWAYYDNRKEAERSDSRYFACHEPWEVDFLILQIQKQQPYSEKDIREAIAQCWKKIAPPRARSIFIEQVLRQLKSTEAL